MKANQMIIKIEVVIDLNEVKKAMKQRNILVNEANEGECQ